VPTTNSQRLELAELLRLEAERLRILNLKALTRAGSGHPGGTLSLAEVMSVLYFGGVLRYDAQDPSWENRDRLVLSEGHTAPILYSALTEAGFKGWSVEALMDLRKNPDVIAQGHTTRGLTPGIDCSTGALGMGGSKSLGMALAARYKGQDYHTFAIIGDGESEEGQIYEAASNAALVGADNLTWILNRNKAQQSAGTHDLSSIDHEKLFNALGWKTIVINGESSDIEKNREFITKLRAALLQAKQDAHHTGQPTVLILDTVKGKGVDFMEYHGQKPGDYKFHGVPPTEEQLARALAQIEARLGSPDPEQISVLLKEGTISVAKRQVDDFNTQRMKERRQKLMEIRQSAQVSYPAYKPTDKPLGTRVGFGGALAWLASQHPEIVATSPDLQDSVHMFDMEKVTRRHGKSNPLGAYFPEGISESNACGKCAGLGYEGLIPFIGTFDNFLLEAADELQHAAAFGSFYVAVGTHSGCGVGPDGKSQMGVAGPGVIDDYSGPDGDMFEMYEPADAQEAADITRLIVERTLREGTPRHPIYLRCTRHNLPHLDRSKIPDYAKKLQDGSYVIADTAGSGRPDLVIVASGATVSAAVKAAAELSTQKIRIRVINVVSLNKIQKADSAFIRDGLPDNTPVLTVHDAQPHALAHRVAEAINQARLLGRKPGILLKSLGANVSPLSNHVGSGTTEENYRRNQLDAAGIAATVKQLLNK
jgi:transketolase